VQRNWVKVAIAVLAGPTLSLSHATLASASSLKEVEARYTKSYRDCPGFKSGVDPEMLDCISAEFEVQDKRLSAAYVMALAALPPSQRASLRAAQRTWIAYRDRWCGITYDRESASAERIAANQCGLEETVLQTIKLEELGAYAESNR
jgi:uncharacterized protein YecT (DUF1311 family)